MDQSVKLVAGYKILQLNISGFTEIKKIYLQQLLHSHNIDIVTLQETHLATKQQSLEHIDLFKLVGATYHRSYGTATYVRNTIRKCRLVEELSENNIFVITVKIKGLHIVNVYKPPKKNWPDIPLPIYDHPTIYVGDFNSHHKNWKFTENDAPGQELVKWSSDNNLSFVFDFFQSDTFLSNHKTESNLDLCWVTRNPSNDKPNNITRTVLDSFFRTGHRPIIYDTNINIPAFIALNWYLYASSVNSLVNSCPPSITGYPILINSILLAGLKSKNKSESLKIKRIRSKNSKRIDENILKYLNNLKFRQWKQMIKGGNYDLKDLWTFYFNSTQFYWAKIPKSRSDEVGDFSQLISIQEVSAAINEMEINETSNVRYELYIKYGPRKLRFWLTNFFNYIVQKPQLPSTYNSSENQENPLHAVILTLFQNILFKKIDSELSILLEQYTKVHFVLEEIPLSLHKYIKRNITRDRKVAVALMPIKINTMNQQSPTEKLPLSCLKLGKVFNKILNLNAYSGIKLASLHLKLELDCIQRQLSKFDCQIFVVKNELLVAVRAESFDNLNTVLKETCDELGKYFNNSDIKVRQSKCCTFNFSTSIRNLRLHKLKDVSINNCKLSHSTRNELRFAGFLFDQKLEYTEQINAKIMELRTVKNLVNLLLDSEWGDDRHCLLMIYEGYVRKKLLKYESIWSACRKAENVNTILMEIRDTILR